MEIRKMSIDEIIRFFEEEGIKLIHKEAEKIIPFLELLLKSAVKHIFDE